MMKDQGKDITGSNTPSNRSDMSNLTLNGKWILLRNRGNPSLRPFLETMGVSDLAIEANEKGDAEHDTIHDITLTRTRYRIQKLSRVNHLILDVPLGEEQVTPMTVEGFAAGEEKDHDGDPRRIQGMKKIRVTSDHLAHVRIESELPTMNGIAIVTDIKTLEPLSSKDEDDPMSSSSSSHKKNIMYVQNLTIVNQKTQQSHHTIRYFVPFEGDMEPTALTAGGNKKPRLETVS